MGVVYRAEDPIIHRAVAVKVLPTADGQTPAEISRARERFAREGQALGSIDHPNIVRVFDVGEDPESCEMYIVMEFVAGQNLERVLAGERLDLEKAVGLVGQLASGLDAAHARGIIHRDIKPSNILVTDDGTVKLADFGITLVETSALTQDMRELGTPAYMSPEQVNGKVLDSRADLFSLGVLTYEILAGRKPFSGADAVSIAYAIAHAEPVAVSVANPALPPALDHVLDRVLAKDPGGRFASGKEFHQALLRCLDGDVSEAAATTTPGWSNRRSAVWGLAGAVLLAAAAVALWPREAAVDPAPVAGVARPKTAPRPSDSSAATSRPESRSMPKVAAKESPPQKAAKRPSVRSGAGATVPPRATASEIAQSRPKPSVPKAAAPVAPAPTVDVTISFAHRIRRGSLIVMLDGVAVFNEPFSKSRLALVQTTVWDPLKAPAGGHTLVARVKGEDGTTYVSDPYKIEFPRDRGIELRIGLKGDSLTVKPKAG
jgi:serine/threonine-protein kinase